MKDTFWILCSVTLVIAMIGMGFAMYSMNQWNDLLWKENMQLRVANAVLESNARPPRPLTSNYEYRGKWDTALVRKWHIDTSEKGGTTAMSSWGQSSGAVVGGDQDPLPCFCPCDSLVEGYDY
jgi:hypothetical protein